MTEYNSTLLVASCRRSTRPRTRAHKSFLPVPLRRSTGCLHRSRPVVNIPAVSQQSTHPLRLRVHCRGHVPALLRLRTLSEPFTDRLHRPVYDLWQELTKVSTSAHFTLHRSCQACSTRAQHSETQIVAQSRLRHWPGKRCAGEHRLAQARRQRAQCRPRLPRPVDVQGENRSAREAAHPPHGHSSWSGVARTGRERGGGWDCLREKAAARGLKGACRSKPTQGTFDKTTAATRGKAVGPRQRRRSSGTGRAAAAGRRARAPVPSILSAFA